VGDARRILSSSHHTVAFTGAGVSTASGVPDFRSPGGVWSRYKPVSIQEFLASEAARRRYWEYKKDTFAAFARAQPNAAHLALARLETEGQLDGIITQNIDGLHQDAGSRIVLELHGTNRRVECLHCGRTFSALEIQERLLAGCEIPLCDECGGPLKSATVSFGQPLPQEILARAFELATRAEVFLVLGSSLVVYPAAAIPQAAAEAGARLILVNREATPLDSLASVVLRGSVEDIVPTLVVA
jgi:NAD-dependent deacetylase